MLEELPGVSLRMIGSVKNGINQRPDSGWGDVVSEITIASSLTEALDGLEEFSHVVVVYWMDRVPPLAQVPTKVHPRGRQDLPLVGLFATRTPHRLNPVGVTVVKLLERRGNVLKVRGLDALDGSPVVDIKPYMPRRAAIIDARTPSWEKKL
jgi:tRNA-Thr(GGU) m(6)t(6)A37 methyltransferase TsaA